MIKLKSFLEIIAFMLLKIVLIAFIIITFIANLKYDISYIEIVQFIENVNHHQLIIADRFSLYAYIIHFFLLVLVTRIIIEVFVNFNSLNSIIEYEVQVWIECRQVCCMP